MAMVVQRTQEQIHSCGIQKTKALIDNLKKITFPVFPDTLSTAVAIALLQIKVENLELFKTYRIDANRMRLLEILFKILGLAR